MREPLLIVVETYDVTNGTMIARKVIDHNNRENRVWLGKHCFWAFRNNHKIVTYAELSE